MAETVSVRIEKEELKEIEKLSKYEKKNKSAILREILDLGISRKRLEIALNRFQNYEATAAKAADIAGIPLTKFLDVLSDRKLEFHYTLEELEEDVGAL